MQLNQCDHSGAAASFIVSVEGRMLLIAFYWQQEANDLVSRIGEKGGGGQKFLRCDWPEH